MRRIAVRQARPDLDGPGMPATGLIEIMRERCSVLIEAVKAQRLTSRVKKTAEAPVPMLPL
jgi:hypothetical protein